MAYAAAVLGVDDVLHPAMYLVDRADPSDAGPASVLDQNTVEAFRKLRDAGVMAVEHADVLIPATRLLHDLTQILRLCLEGRFEPATAPSLSSATATFNFASSMNFLIWSGSSCRLTAYSTTP